MLPTPYIQPDAPSADFLAPDNIKRASLLRDLELGALAVSDPTGGLRQATWEGYLDGQTFKVRIPPTGTVTDVLTVTGNVTELSLAFDSNMRPHFAYVEDGTPKFYWYDTSTSQNTITAYPGITSPRLCLDDKRDRQSASRDVLMFYLREGSLYCRQQRDRYLTEYFLQATDALAIDQVGMAAHNRLRIELVYDAGCAEPLPIVVVLDTLRIAGKVTQGTIHRNLYTVATWLYPVEVEDDLTAHGWLVEGRLYAVQVEGFNSAVALIEGEKVQIYADVFHAQYPEAFSAAATLLSGEKVQIYADVFHTQAPEAFSAAVALLGGEKVGAGVTTTMPSDSLTTQGLLTGGEFTS